MTPSVRPEAIETNLPAFALLPHVDSEVPIPTSLSLTPGDERFDFRIDFKLASDEVFALYSALKHTVADTERDTSLAIPEDAARVLGEAVLRHLRNAAVHEQALGVLANRLSLDADSVLRLLADVVASEAPRGAGNDAFSDQDETALNEAGVDLSGPAEGKADPVLTTAARYARFMSNSLTVRDAAQLLGVTEGRVRQRLAERTLYGVRSGTREWRLPQWQFVSDGALPGLAEVLTTLPVALHPLAIDSFFKSPSPELNVDGEDLSPVQWLETGGDPTLVAELVEGLPFAA